MITAQRRSRPHGSPLPYSGTPALSHDEERELARRVSDGDEEARDHLVRAHIGLVVSIARRFLGRGLELEDLVAEGVLGLIRAAELFDPSRGLRLSTYAWLYIRSSVQASLKSSRGVRLPMDTFRLAQRWRRTAARLQAESGIEPDPGDVAQALELQPQRASAVLSAVRLNRSHPEDHAGWASSIPDDREGEPSTGMSDDEDRARLRASLAILDDREQAVLRMRFGLDGAAPLTLWEVGAILGVVRERVRQLEASAMEKLRQALTED